MNRINYDEGVRQRAKGSLAQAAGEEEVCDYVRCYEQGIRLPIATVRPIDPHTVVMILDLMLGARYGWVL
ncbi:hypothetical protein RhiJN_16096 [Ceratobasidium sp. AG-Ba]|nr:hypothetical protein RhiJN_16096 [Ceratobasidium sp. AG-Ba]